jgi:hypothetical protein
MRLITSFDFLGAEPQTFIFRQTRFKTLFGGIISLLAATSIIASSLYFISTSFMKKEVNVISNRTSSFYKNFNHTAVPFLLFPANMRGDLYDSNILYPVVQYWAYYPENQGVVNITMLTVKQCDMSDVIGYESLFLDFKDLDRHYCYDKGGKNLTLFGNYGDIVNGYSKMHIYLSTCVNGSLYNPNPDKYTCAPSETIVNSLTALPVHVYATYPDNDINFKNDTHPFITYLKTEDFTMSWGNKNTYLYVVSKLFVYSDFGFIFEDIVEKESYTGHVGQTLTLAGSTFFVQESFGMILVNLNDKADMHYRSYTKFESLVANISGVIDLILIFSKLFIHTISKKFLLLEYVNHQLTDYKTDDLKAFSRGGFKIENNNGRNLRFNNYTNILPQHSTLQTRPTVPGIDVLPLIKRKPYKLSYHEILLPFRCSDRYNELFKKIESYVHSKLSVDFFMKESEEFEKLKLYMFNSQELYVFNNIDKLKSRILTSTPEDGFDYQRFKQVYLNVLSNNKLIDVIT